MVMPLAKTTSDHIPCKIVIGTAIPKSNIFRFENFWPQHPGFADTVKEGWEKQMRNSRDSASSLVGKLKNTRYSLKQWSKKLSNLSALISMCNKVIFLSKLLGRIQATFSSRMESQIHCQGAPSDSARI